MRLNDSMTKRQRGRLAAGLLCTSAGLVITVLVPSFYQGHGNLIHFAKGFLMGLGIVLLVSSLVALRSKKVQEQS